MSTRHPQNCGNSIVPVGLILAGLLLGSTSAQENQRTVRQKVRTANIGTFEDYLKKRLPDLPSDKIVLHATDLNQRFDIDKLTGLVPPKNPFGPMEKLPVGDPRVAQYEKELREFLQRRQVLIQVRKEYDRGVSEQKRLRFAALLQPIQSNYFAGKVAKWNGSIFWAPASKTTDINLQFGDEARSVFGPIPPFDTSKLGTVTRPDGWTVVTGVLVGEVEGNQIELKPNTSKPGNPLEFLHRDVNGNIVSWTPTIEKCDKPSLAGGVTPCGTSSRLSRAVKGNVEWIALARKTKSVQTLTADPYWMPGNSSYELIGYIGFNRASGEVVFFDGTYSGMKFNWDAPTVPPGGSGYADDAGRAIAAQTYDTTFKIGCVACHDNKKPRIITPYIKQARVGYRDDALAKTFSLGALLPSLPRGERAPYRVVGSSYTAVHAQILNQSRMVDDPTNNCNVCHGLTNSGAGRFASDAVGKLGTLSGDPGIENSYRTDWALRTGAGKIHPWMVPDSGNDISSVPPVLTDADWATLKTVIDNAPASSLPVYTSAPAPESLISDSTRIADPSAPTNFSLTVADNRDGAAEVMPKEIHLTWNYLNGLGGVPERDDVRFNVAILEKDIPPGGGNPSMTDFPTIDDAKGLNAVEVGGGVYSDGNLIILEDVSFSGHQQWTDPSPTTIPRQYRVDFPATKNKRYLIRVVAKRFPFDQSAELYSGADHVFSVDVQ
jgi:hypothetical protein